ncbi:hypothetical protein Ferp_0530 [Ferroglobus placidus DSM 10642]|uniref:Uncharacterized protein n=1 Tax=Ferroglobus placidus (strain DSM 10642 / AEDII12DO) TaxID=589924 RepID=D3S371_FERPA|nr:helix-turn-helix domain-containing protein [Ferroglobus placidus]ADC64704.1 hypothetical protein Ferp_0530 [Ferroglobus placidus DSM 10642]
MTLVGEERVRKFVIVQFYDSEMEDTPFLVETDLTEEELSEQVEEIIKRYEEEEFYDWSYDDIVEELKKRGVIRVIPADFYRIYA